MEAFNGVTCIKGEIHSIMTLMRLNTRWSQPLRSSQATVQDENPVVQSYRRLNEYLEGIFDLRELDCVMYLAPFHNVIVSNQGSGPVTSAALSSLSKFVMFGFMSLEYPRIREGITLVANCISRCVFEETDWESDEVILMKLLELSTLVLRCDASCLLTVSSVWDIYSTCLSIHGQYRASKILRSEAETALRHLTLTAFSRTSFSFGRQFQPAVPPNQPQMSFQLVPNSVQQYVDSSTSEPDARRGPSSWEDLSQMNQFSGTVGMTLLLSKIMAVLSGLLDLQAQSIETVKFALSLINIALEAGGPALGQIRPLVDVLRGDICRHLLRASQSDDLAVFSLTLRVVFNLFMSIKDHMKTQLEVFLTSVHLRLLQAHQPTAITSVSLAREELALESLLEFCREPALMQDLYVNYDCDEQCTNLFDSIITTLCSRCVPFGVDSTQPQSPTDSPSSDTSFRSNILTRLSLYGVTTVIRTVATRCSIEASTPNSLSREPTPNIATTSTDNAPESPVKALDAGSWSNKSSGKDSVVSEDPAGNTGMTTAPNASSVDSVEVSVDNWCISEPDSNIVDLNPISTPQKSGFSLEHPLKTGMENSTSMSPFLSHNSHSLLPNRSSGILTDHQNSSLSRQTSKTQSENGQDVGQESENSDAENDMEMLTRARTVELLRQRKEKKQRMLMAAEKFNSKPLKNEWIEFALEQGLLQPYANSSADALEVQALPSKTNTTSPAANSATAKHKFPASPVSVARFLKDTPGLGKTQVGEFLSKGPADLYPFNAAVLMEYVNTFDFSGKDSSFVKALRLFLGHFRLPGEAQCIDRLMEAFSGRLFQHLGSGKPFANADAAFILSFSTIMLNTDLHNPQIQQQKKMTKEQFIKNNRGINANQDLPREYLETLYDEIKTRQIQVNFDIGDNSNLAPVPDFMDPASWNKLLNKGAAHQLPAAFTPTVTARRTAAKSRSQQLSNYRHQLISAHEKDMFLVMAKSVLNALMAVWDNTNDDNVLYRVMEGILDYSSICLSLRLHNLFNRMIKTFANKIVTNLEKSRLGFDLPSSAPGATGKLSKNSYILTLRKMEAERGRKHNLVLLLGSEINAIIAPPQPARVDHNHSVEGFTVPSTIPGKDPLVEIHKPGEPSVSGQHQQQQLVHASNVKIVSMGDTSASYPPSNVAPEPPSSGLNWTGASLVRGELMAKIFFNLVISNPIVLEKDAWMATFQLLIWIRGRGCLPEVLAALDDNWYECRSASVPTTSGNKPAPPLQAAVSAGNKRQPSVFAAQCHAHAQGLSDYQAVENANNQNQSGGSIWSSIGSLIWTNASASQSQNSSLPTESVFSHPLDGNSSLYASKNHMHGQSTPENGCSNILRDKNADDYLRLSLNTSPLSRVLPTIVSLHEKNYLDVFNCVVDVLKIKIGVLLNMAATRPASDGSGDGSTGGSGSSTTSIIHKASLVANTAGFEMDAVVLLEWLTALVITNKTRIASMWPPVHGLLKYVLLDNSKHAAMVCPYFMERLVLFVLRCCCELMNDQESSSDCSTSDIVGGPMAAIEGKQFHSESSRSLTLTSAIITQALEKKIEKCEYWSSLRLLRSLPPGFTVGIADRFGSALLTFVRVSPGSTAIVNLEDWYLIFSLLSNASAGVGARPYVWGIIHYLINSNLITDKNFSPCRHLLLRYLFGVFVSPENAQIESSSSLATANGPAGWQLPALECLLRMTCMVLAGYVDMIGASSDKPQEPVAHFTSHSLPLPHNITTPKRLDSHSGQSRATPTGRLSLGVADVSSSHNHHHHQIPSPRQGNVSSAGGKLFTFPLPVINHRNIRGAMRPTSGTGHSPVASRSGSPVSNAGGIDGTNPAENMHRLTVVSVKLHRTEEIEVLWLETLKTFADVSNSPIPEVARKASFCLQATLLGGGIANLPVDLWSRAVTEILERLPLSLVASASRLTTSAEYAVAAESCLRSCNVVFEMFITQIKILRTAKEFQTFWLRFSSILATNANVLPRGVHFHEEMLEMIAALMRLLRPPAVVSISSQSPKQAASKPPPAPVTRSEEESSGIWSFLWSKAPVLAPAPAPATTSVIAVTTTGSAQDSTSSELAAESPGSSLKSEIDPTDPKRLPLLDTSMMPNTSHAHNDAEDEGGLLSLSWKTMCSLNPMLQNNLKLKNPQLVSDLNRFSEMQDKRLTVTAAAQKEVLKQGLQNNSKQAEKSPEKGSPIPSTESESASNLSTTLSSSSDDREGARSSSARGARAQVV